MNTSNRSIIRNTFYIQLTAFILLSLSSSVGSMIDGVVIGQFLGVDSIAAFGIINPLMIAFSIIGAVIVAGARPQKRRQILRPLPQRLPDLRPTEADPSAVRRRPHLPHRPSHDRRLSERHPLHLRPQTQQHTCQNIVYRGADPSL